MIIHYRKTRLNTDRIARIVGNTAMDGDIVRSVSLPFVARADGFITRSPQIATAD